jgi:L-rhamnose isomerase/sugar isomerase
MADEAAVKAVLRAFRIELPSWAFGLSGTRFKVFGQPAYAGSGYAGKIAAGRVGGTAAGWG